MDVDAESGLPRIKPEPGETALPTSSTSTPKMTTPMTIPSEDAPRASSASSASHSSTDRCVICLDAITEPCVAQPCGHRHFDFLCLLSWLLSRRPFCPLCKATVETVQYGDNLASTFPVPDKSEETVPHTAEPAPAPSSTSLGRSAPRRRRRPLATLSSSLSESPAAALERRRRVYRLGLYAHHVGANRHSRYYRELTPQLFGQDPDLVSRARAFLRRELQVFWDDRPLSTETTVRGGRRANNVEFLLEYIVAILQTIDLQDSAGQAEELLQGFFRGRRDHTRQFLHELRSFLRSPYLTLASWDRHVQYGPPGPLFRGEDDEEAGEVGDGDGATVADTQGPSEIKRQPVPRGDYYRPPRCRGRSSRRVDRVRSSSRAHVDEASRRYDPS